MTAAHETTKTVVERIYYPKHDPRRASPLYRDNRRMLIHELKYGCWICGVRKRLETHHWFERSEWRNLDPAQVKGALIELDFYGYSRRMAETPVESPDDVRNLVVLCVDHHRHRERGIHDLTFRIWIAQKAARAGVSITDTTP